MRLFHFSDDPGIGTFVPRPVGVAAARPAGREWLNGPMVWAIDEPHQPLYLFPRECPRVLLWPTATTTAADRERWFPDTSYRMRAFVEAAWLDRLASATLHRYEFAAATFADLADAGMWVSRTAVVPIAHGEVRDLVGELRAQSVDLVVLDSLVPLRELWATSLHASGIRLRNAAGWAASRDSAAVAFR